MSLRAEDVAVKVDWRRVEIICAAAGIDAVGETHGGRFTGVVLCRRPKAKTLRHRGRRAVGVIYLEELIGLIVIDCGAQQEQSGELACR